MARLQIARLRVVALEAELGHPFRMERAEGIEHHAAMAIAALDPCAVFGGRRSTHHGKRQCNRDSHSGFSITVTCDSIGPYLYGFVSPVGVKPSLRQNGSTSSFV